MVRSSAREFPGGVEGTLRRRNSSAVDSWVGEGPHCLTTPVRL